MTNEAQARELLARYKIMGDAIAEAWNSGTCSTQDLPPIELADNERVFLGKVALEAALAQPPVPLPDDVAKVIEGLRKHIYKLPDNYFSDEDYGCNLDCPEGLIMCILDHGSLGQKVMQELTACDFTVVNTDALNGAVDTIEALSRQLEAAKPKVENGEIIRQTLERVDRPKIGEGAYSYATREQLPRMLREQATDALLFEAAPHVIIDAWNIAQMASDELEAAERERDQLFDVAKEQLENANASEQANLVAERRVGELEVGLKKCLTELEYAYEGDEEVAEQHGVGEVIREARALLTAPAQAEGEADNA